MQDLLKGSKGIRSDVITQIALSLQLIVRRTIQRLKQAQLLVGSLPMGQEVLNRPMIKGKDCSLLVPIIVLLVSVEGH